MMSVRTFVVSVFCLFTIFQTVVAQATSPWPFDRPTLETLHASKKRVFAHYFTPFPLSLDNREPSTDRYSANYLLPGGAPSEAHPQGRYYGTGGFLRERPLPTSPQPDGTDYELVNMRKEIHAAAEIGLDGFTLDILGYGPRSTWWPESKKLMQAATKEDADFKILLMPDMDAETFKIAADPDGANLTAAVHELAASPSVYRQGGDLVISPYNAQKRPAEWWQAWIARYEEAYGDKIFFVPLFQNWRAHVDKFVPFSRGVAEWGARETGGTAGNGSPRWIAFSRDVHATKPGFISMAPVAPQDFRPKDDPLGPYGVRFWESKNSENFRAMWTNAIKGDSDWVQLITWNDYGECSEIAPSSGTQYAFYDLAAYYTTWFKTGRPPPIVRNVIYYFHRIQHSSALFSKNQVAAFKRAGETPVADEIELLAFIGGASRVTLRIAIGGETQTTTVDPGIQSFKVPLPTNEIVRPRFAIVREGVVVASVTSAFEINQPLQWQDFLYRAGSSSRAPVTGLH